MSEKIYACLLRLYPSRFQEAYREEALQLFRDRARDETGFLSRARLWLDLLGDLAISVPQSYRAVSAAAARPCYDGAPLFLTLEDEAIGFRSLLYGAMASVMIYAAVLTLAAQKGTALPIRGSGIPQPPSYSDARPSSFAAAEAPSYDENSVVSVAELHEGTVAVTGELPELQQRFLRAINSGGENYGVADTLSGERAVVPGLVAQAAAAVNDGVKPLAFDVVSIHENKSEADPQNATMGATPDGFRARNVPLLSILQGAYRPTDGNFTFRLKQITGLPTWATYEVRYDIDAKLSDADLPRWKDPTLQPAMLRSMLQTMLADRFKLVVHRENKVVPIYELTVGKKGPKIKPSEGATFEEIERKHPGAHMLGDGVIAASGPGQQWFFGVTMADLGTLLSNLAGRPVKDKTGLAGRYDVSYQIELRPLPREDGTPAPVPPDFFSSQISTIVEEQLGLRVNAAKGPVESLVIDHVEQLSEN